jgi:D-3-phosphoglycerate dehydrogenase
MKIVVTEPLLMGDEVKTALATLGRVSWGPFSDGELKAEVKDCDVLMVRLSRYIGKALLSRATRLQFIITATTGLDHIDLSAAHAAGVRVISLRDCPEDIQDVSATAEHTLGLLIALLRRIPAASAHVLSGGWNRNLFWGTQLRGKRLGVVGCGRIGSMVARYGAALGMDVLAHDTDPAAVLAPATSVSFEELLSRADAISIHVSAVPENRHLIDKRALEQVKLGAVLINTARGSILEEAAVVDAVTGGRLAGVAVDVVEGEERSDLKSSPLLACARAGYNVLITPHIGGATSEAIAQTEFALVRVLMAAIRERRESFSR